MMLSSLEMITDGHIKVHGEISLPTISPLLSQSKQFLNNYKQLCFDLEAVTQTDSAGLALLIEWLRIARQQNIKVHFINLPDQLINIAKVCGLETILTTKCR